MNDQGAGLDSPAEPGPDDGIIRTNRLEPGRVDVVLGSHPNRIPTPPRRSIRVTVMCLLLALLSLCLLFSQLNRHAAELLPQATVHPPAGTASISR